jgi:hypothetical protein
MNVDEILRTLNQEQVDYLPVEERKERRIQVLREAIRQAKGS